jgi:hypothetical protein
MKLKTIAEVLWFLDSLDGYGLLVSDEDLVAERLKELDNDLID